MTRLCLKALDDLPQTLRPTYDPAAHGIGILHIGLGAFHRAHQAAYTDAALGEKGGDWRILGVSLRSTALVDALAAQDGLFTLTERGAGPDRVRVIGAIAGTIAASRDSGAVLAAFMQPGIRVVTLTVTEKAYGFDRAAKGINPAHPDIAADLKSPRNPSGVLGLLTEGLRQRRAAGLPAPAILCCDNLPDNGALLRAGVLDFARRIDADLARWIKATVHFPASMVDRITPAATDSTAARIRDRFDLEDAAAIESEAFSQWVIEDDFPQGRPYWESGGALFVADVAPYERMKLRMLNGAHSLIAYAGFLAGHVHVRDAMQDAALVALVDRHIQAAARTVGHLPDIDLDAYRRDLLARFANPSIAHATFQIAMDGTEKLPQRILAPALDALATGDDIAPFAFATAAWMHYCTGRDARGEPYDLRDPRGAEIRDAVAGAGDAAALCSALLALPDLFPTALTTSAPFRDACVARLSVMLAQGMATAIRQEAA